MSAMEQVFSNPMLLTFILDGLTSQDLLQTRALGKLWRDEANRLIRLRQRKFFFSPSTKTASPLGQNDLEWVKSWENALQISFSYSQKRGTFIRASRRLLNTDHPTYDFEASSLDPAERQGESAFFQETEDFYNNDGTTRRPNFNCKMAGCTLEEFTSFLKTMFVPQNQDGWTNSIFPCMSFRFENGRLRDRREISHFFEVIGSKIRYLTVGFTHMCNLSNVTNVHGIWDNNDKWDHEYEVFKLVPNLEVLTVVMYLEWRDDKDEEAGEYFTAFRNEPPLKILPLEQKEGQDKGVQNPQNNPFFHLRCLRIAGLGDFVTEHIARWVLLKAPKVESVFYELNLYPRLLPFLNGEVSWVNPNYVTRLTLSGRPLSLVSPIMTTLCLGVFDPKPQVLEYMAQAIHLQNSRFGGTQKLKSLQLNLMTLPDVWGHKPYNLPAVRPLLKILREVADSLETLTLFGGAAVFLEGLLQLEFLKKVEHHQNSTIPVLQTFPRVQKLLVSLGDTQRLSRREFCVYPKMVGQNFDRDLNVTSVTTLSKVFPKVSELNLDARFIGMERSQYTYRWQAFLPYSDSFLDIEQGQGQGHGFVDEVKSVKKIYFGPQYMERTFTVWKFSELETLCLDYAPFSRICLAVWSLTSLKTLTINKIPILDWEGYDDEDVGLPSMWETILKGLPMEVMTDYIEQVQERIPTVDLGNVIQFLRDTRAALRPLLNAPSIMDLDQLTHFKCFYYMGGPDVSEPFLASELSLLRLLLLPPTCHLTVWAMCSEPRNLQPVPYETLKEAVGPMISSHSRVSLRTVRYAGHDPGLPL